MSFFSDFLIAGRREAKKVAATDNPTKHWTGVAAKGLTCLDLATLYGLVTGVTDVDEVVDLEDEFEDLSAGDGPADVRLFPEAFTRALAAAGPEDIARLARGWRADEGGGVSDWKSPEVKELLGELSGLARQAIEARKPIMLCVSGF